MSRKKIERQLKIEQYIQIKESVTIDELVKEFKVNNITIHRDLTELEKKGSIRKVLSGAIGISKKILDSSNYFFNRAAEFWEEKNAISEKALTLIKPNCFYYLSGSTTLLPFVEKLSQLYRDNINIITSNIIFQMELSNNDNIKVYSVGGELVKGYQETTGPFAWKHIEEFKVDAVFFSVGGITEDLYLTDLRELNATNIQLYMKNSKLKVLVTDHSKFGVNTYFKISHISDVDIFITDKGIDKKYLDKLKRIKTLKVIIAT